MPKYYVEQYELYYSTYAVEADSAAKAVEAQLNGEGELVDDSNEYLEAAEMYGTYPKNLCEGVEHLVNVCEFVPGIRQVYAAGDD